VAIRIVTDSTSDIGAELALRLGITLVPLNVLFGRETFLDRVSITTDEFYRRLSQESVFPTTTQPAPAVFAEAYRKILKEGDDILVLVVSSKLSGTFQSAVGAIGLVGAEGHIKVVDSQTTAMGLGLLAITAAKLSAQPSATLDGVSIAVQERVARSHVVVLFDTLKYLARGGRIGRAQGLLGSVLAVKPVLTMKDGVVTPLTRLRSMAGGADYLYNYVRGFPRIEELAVEHATTPGEADNLTERLGAFYPKERILRSTMSPVLGTYMGPNVLSVTVLEAAA
jgi:DegV family protein with EDD domain